MAMMVAVYLTKCLDGVIQAITRTYTQLYWHLHKRRKKEEEEEEGE